MHLSSKLTHSPRSSLQPTGRVFTPEELMQYNGADKTKPVYVRMDAGDDAMQHTQTKHSTC